MPRVRVRDAGSDLHPRRPLGEIGQAGIDLAIKSFVGEPRSIVTVVFGELDPFEHSFNRGVPENQQINRHSRSLSNTKSRAMGLANVDPSYSISSLAK